MLTAKRLYATESNAWTSAVSGNWQDVASWSLGVLPGTNQDIFITNAGFKAVAIQGSTVSGFPQTLTVDSITISSPPTGFNTLLMNFTGTKLPLTIGDANSFGSLAISNRSAMVIFSSALDVQNVESNGVEQGAFEVDGVFSASVNSLVSAGFLTLNPGGTNSITNSLFSVGMQNVRGQFNQQGGTNSGDIVLGLDGRYDLYGGSVTGSVVIFEPGFFVQHDGSVSGGISVGSGVYELDAGFISCSNLSIGGNYPANYPYGGGDFEQNGGTNTVGDILMTQGPGSFTLAGGVLKAATLTILPFNGHLGMSADTFNQSGGYHTNGVITLTGAVGFDNVIMPGTYALSGGILETPLMNLSMGAVMQSGGTNRVGTLSLSNSSTYSLSGGLLVAGTIQLAGGSLFQHSGGTISNANMLILSSATWQEQTNGESLGQLQLVNSNSIVLPPSATSVMQFGDSSGVTWTSASLVIENWAGSLYGGGLQQIIFGNSAAALTPQQVGEIQFQNPAGLPAGLYSARILATGEVVPDSGKPLALRVGIMLQSNGIVQLTIEGQIGSNYGIQISSNLHDWTPLTNQSNSTGTILIMDGNVSSAPVEFYRAVLLP